MIACLIRICSLLIHVLKKINFEIFSNLGEFKNILGSLNLKNFSVIFGTHPRILKSKKLSLVSETSEGEGGSSEGNTKKVPSQEKVPVSPDYLPTHLLGFFDNIPNTYQEL